MCMVVTETGVAALWRAGLRAGDGVCRPLPWVLDGLEVWAAATVQIGHMKHQHLYFG